MNEYYEGLLKLCGFEDHEIELERQRIEKAFRKLQLGPEDMDMAESWVKQHHDVELIGVRKLLGAWVKDLVDLVLAKDEGKKVVYYGFPTIVTPGLMLALASDSIYVSCPDAVLCHAMGQIFNKLNPILEAGEENGLPPGHALCSLWQVRVGALAKGMIPVPDIMIASSFYCDMSKAGELLAEKYDVQRIIVDGSMDSAWGEYPEYFSERVDFLGAELNQCFEKAREILGVEVTRDIWDKSAAISRDFYSGVGKLVQLMQADPMPISQVELELPLNLGAACTGRAVAEGAKALAILIEEVKKRVDEGIGVVEKGAPRVGMFLSSLSDPSITRMIEKAGLAVSATFFTVPPPKGKNKPKITYNTFGEIMANREMMLALYHSSYAFVKRVEVAIQKLNPDGFIYNYQFNCRPAAQMSHMVKKWVEDKIGIPILSLEADGYDSRNYSAAALRTRVETFAEMLRARKAAATG
jgi:benzoyl-CoA reductase/2-hydroxyglutaryl-CoA dehydratase subunit BcrC/BadD/HgdB